MSLIPKSMQLERRLTWLPLFCIVVANMVGVGIYTTSGLIIQDLMHPTLMLFAWLLGALFSLCGALCYGELGAMFPVAGGEYVFLREGLGKPIAFLSGWISLFVGFSAPLAAAALASGLYLAKTLPWISDPLGVQSLAVLFILLMTLIHCCGLHVGVMVQNIFTLLKIFLIISIVGGAFYAGQGSFDHFGGAVPWSRVFSVDFAIALMFVSFAYSGWNASAYLGGEIQNPGRNIPLSIISGTLFVAIIYLLLNVTFIYAVEPRAMAGVREIGHLATVQLFGDKIGNFYGLGISIALFSTLGVLVMTGPRVYYAMAKDDVFFSFLAVIHPGTKVPTRSIILQSSIAIMLVLTATFRSLLLYMGFVLSIFSTLAVIAMMLLRTRRPEHDRPYRTWGYPATPFIFILGNIGIILFSLTSQTPAFFWGLGTILSGLIFYWIFQRLQKKNTRS